MFTGKKFQKTSRNLFTDLTLQARNKAMNNFVLNYNKKWVKGKFFKITETRSLFLNFPIMTKLQQLNLTSQC